MKYNSICCICGHETEPCDHIVEHGFKKEEAGFIQLTVDWSRRQLRGIRTINFCPSCARKSYTIEELKTIGNYNQWSY